MLKKETLTRIATLLKIKATDLETAIKDDKEVDVTIDDKLAVFTEDEVTTLKGNSYKDGKKAGVEMEVDTIKKELELDFQGKTVKGLVEAAGKKAVKDANIEPDKKVTELEGKLKTAQLTATEALQKLADKEGEVSSIKTQGLITKDLPTASLPGEKIIALMKMDGYDYNNEDGKIVWLKDGKPMTDKIGNNMTTKDVTTEYIIANKLTVEGTGAAGGGRGKGDESKGAAVYTKLSEIKAAFKAENKSELGEEFAKVVQEAAKVDGFDMNS